MTPKRKIRKAVLPVAGLGTRFFPATKAQPKEMLPIVDKPLIQYAVEEAVASGIEFIILVTSEGKDALENHFDSNPELEQLLAGRGKTQELEIIRQVSRLAKVWSVRQVEPHGLGHAIGCARDLVGEEPFAVLLPDDIIDNQPPALKQLIEVYDEHPGCIIATREVPREQVRRYGILGVEPVNPARPAWRERLFRVTQLVEKPAPEQAPSRYGVIGRYVFEPEIFACIDETQPGAVGEIQITDSLMLYARSGAVYAFAFEGAHFDAGNKLGMLQAQVEFGLKH
ncbi:MAG: UTP--glucose-1-phosphate uridylyltransferase GalU, partial [Acidobacteria bacterium]|nr:UTP--glucose-1-phosphate uridylyltransferase GalU [Acidobacteriota bacterium]